MKYPFSRLGTFANASMVILVYVGCLLSPIDVALGADDAVIARIVDYQMPVSIRGAKTITAAIGTELHKNDTVVVLQAGSATLVFQDGAVHRFAGPTVIALTSSSKAKEGIIGKLTSELAEMIFPSKKEPEKVRLAVRGTTFSEVPALTLPLLVYPPHTAVLMAAPDRLEWVPIEGATLYTVSLSDQNHLLWHERTQNADISLPVDTLWFHPGEPYFWTVEAEIGRTSLHSEQSTFELADPVVCHQITQAVNEIKGLGLEPRLAALLRINMYENHNMLIEEYREIEALLRQWPQDHMALLAKAELCAAMNMYREAVACYHRALQR